MSLRRPTGDGVVGYQDLAGLGAYWMTYPGLIAHWKLDETDGNAAPDALGRFDGTVHGSPQWRPDEGRIRGALELDGIDDYIRTGNVLNPADGPFTVFALGQGRPARPGDPLAVGPVRPGRGVAWHRCRRRRPPDQPDRHQPPHGSACFADLRHRRRSGTSSGSSGMVPIVALYVDGRAGRRDTRKLGTLKSSTGGFNIGAGKRPRARQLLVRPPRRHPPLQSGRQAVIGQSR